MKVDAVKAWNLKRELGQVTRNKCKKSLLLWLKGQERTKVNLNATCKNEVQENKLRV